MPRTGSLRWVVALAAIVTMVSACESSSAPNSGGSSGTSTLNKVVSSGTLRVGTITGDAPFVDVGSSGDLQGYDIDMANLLAKSLGVKIAFTKTDVAGRVTSLQTGKVDVVFADFSMTLKRSQVIAFTDPYALEGIQVMVHVESPLQSFSDLNKPNVKIAVPRGAAQIPFVQALFPKAQLVQFPGTGDVVSALASGQVDAAADNSIQYDQVIKAQPGKFRLIPGYIQRFEVNIGLQQGDYIWFQYLNTFVRQVNTDGENYAIWQKWIGGTPPPFIEQG